MFLDAVLHRLERALVGTAVAFYLVGLAAWLAG